jgi:transcriptional regulator with XRE-family HTH domain
VATPPSTNDDNGEAQRLLEEFGREIAAARERLGLTQTQAAARIGRKQQGWSDMEHGVRNISVRTLVKVARSVGLAVRITTVSRPRDSRSRDHR